MHVARCGWIICVLFICNDECRSVFGSGKALAVRAPDFPERGVSLTLLSLDFQEKALGLPDDEVE